MGASVLETRIAVIELAAGGVSCLRIPALSGYHHRAILHAVSTVNFFQNNNRTFLKSVLFRGAMLPAGSTTVASFRNAPWSSLNFFICFPLILISLVPQHY